MSGGAARADADDRRLLATAGTQARRSGFGPGGGAGMPWALSRWTDGTLFSLVVGVVMGAQADELPADFANDRGRLYFGPDFDWQAQKAMLPHTLAQIRAQLGWIEERLGSAKPNCSHKRSHKIDPSIFSKNERVGVSEPWFVTTI